MKMGVEQNSIVASDTQDLDLRLARLSRTHPLSLDEISQVSLGKRNKSEHVNNKICVAKPQRRAHGVNIDNSKSPRRILHEDFVGRDPGGQVAFSRPPIRL